MRLTGAVAWDRMGGRVKTFPETLPMPRKPTGRPNGRPKGGMDKKRREAIAKAESGGIMPLDVMLEAMREHHAAKRTDAAVAVAAIAAPYVHARLSATTVQQHLVGKLEVVFVDDRGEIEGPDGAGETLATAATSAASAAESGTQ